MRLESCTFMHAKKKEMLLQNQLICKRLLQIVAWSRSHSEDAVFSIETSSNTSSTKQRWIVVMAFSSNSCQVSSFMSWGFSPSRIVLSSTALCKDGIHPNLPSAEIDDAIELLNIEFDRRYLQVDLALILIIVIFGEDVSMTGSIGAAQQKQITWSTKTLKKRRRYSKVNKNPTNNITWFTDQTDCMYVHRRRGRNCIKILGEYNKNYLHLMLRRLQVLDGRQEQWILMAKLLSRISHLDELHP